MKIGLVGVGSIADFHVRAFQKNTGATIVSICSRSAGRVETKKREWNVEKSSTDYLDLVNDKGLDAIDIVAPNNLHAPIAIAALEAKKHVFCEKPPALNAEDAQRMMQSASRNGRVLMYGFMFRFSEKMRLVRELIRNGEVGSIYYVKTGVVRRAGNPGGWFASRAVAGGGPLIDVGVHLIDLASFLMGEPAPVSAYGKTFSGIGRRENIRARQAGWKSVMKDEFPNDVEDTAVAMVTFENGACLSVETSFSSHIKDDLMYLEILGTRGGITVEPVLEIHSEKDNYLIDVKPRVNCESFDYQGSIDAEISHFVECVAKGIPCESPAESGTRVMKIIDAIYASARTGRVTAI
jgi:predicted dehydrogenase